MRAGFTAELEAVEAQISDRLRRCAAVFSGVPEAVVEPTPAAARALIEAGQDLRREGREIDLRLVALMARQAPVACDLRWMLTMVQVAQHQILLANQLGLIGEQLAEIDPDVIDRAQTREKLSAMARHAAQQLATAAAVFSAHDPEGAARVQHEDDLLDRSNRQICGAALEVNARPEERELALRHVLIARSLERVGDNAVSIARHTASLVEGDVHGLAVASGTAAG